MARSRTLPSGTMPSWTFTRRSAGALATLVLLLVITGCQVGEEREQELGDAIAADINAHLPLVLDPPLTIYLSAVGHRVAQASERPEVPYRFYIINTETVNAFALPGGHIYVTRGLLERTDNVSELAGVLAHEVAHVAARHGIQALERELRTGSLISLMYNLFLGGEPEILDQRALDIGRRLWFASHSRAAEREADRLAVRYLVSSGVDPQGMVTLLETLLQEEEDEHGRAVEWFSTHPLTAERVRLLTRKIGRMDAATDEELIEDLRSYSDFLDRLERLPPPPDAGA